MRGEPYGSNLEDIKFGQCGRKGWAQSKQVGTEEEETEKDGSTIDIRPVQLYLMSVHTEYCYY